MELFVASDIFGRTPELDEITSELTDNYSKITLLDPYAGKYNDFQCEKDAYVYFQQHVGLDTYIRTASDAVQENQAAAHFLGFSVGASAFWVLSNERICHERTTVFCFYGSQIRSYPEIHPKVETIVIFPQVEDHFDVQKLASNVSQKTNVRCVKTQYLHGFMNKRSENYNEDGCLECLEFIKKQSASQTRLLE